MKDQLSINNASIKNEELGIAKKRLRHHPIRGEGSGRSVASAYEQQKRVLKVSTPAQLNRNKRFVTQEEIYLRKMMQENRVSQVEIANHEGVDQSAINYRLKSLTPDSLEHFERLIKKLAQASPSKSRSL